MLYLVKYYFIRGHSSTGVFHVFEIMQVVQNRTDVDAYWSKESKLKLDKSSQLAIICLKLTIETIEQGVKYVQS